MPSTGLDRDTGKPLSGLAHVRQSFQVIFTTRISERVMRRTFGSKVPSLLVRENLVGSSLTKFFMAVATAVDLWEPRLRIVQILYPAPPNSPATMRIGGIAMAIVADYRPNALQGDVINDVQRITL